MSLENCIRLAYSAVAKGLRCGGSGGGRKSRRTICSHPIDGMMPIK